MNCKVAHVTTIDMSLRYLLLNQLQSLKQAGYEVVGISSPGPDVPAVERAGIRHIPVSMTRRGFTPLADLHALWKLYRILRREHFTIVHTHTPKAGVFGRLMARVAGVPIIVHTSHGFIFHDQSPRLWRYFFITLEKIAARCADLIFSVNPEDVETAIREGIWPQEKIMLLGDGGIGVDPVLLDPSRFSGEQILSKKREIGLPVDAPVVGFVGRMVREKGLLELFAAARLVRERVPDARFVFIGPVDKSKPDAVTPDAASKYDIADICHFLGLRQDLPELYALMNVFVLPSHREGLPVSPMEASAMKVPCVVTDVRGSRQVVEQGHNGLVVPCGDVSALAGAIISLLTDREKARRMGEEGRRMALTRFDQRIVFERTKKEYARLLMERGLPVPQGASANATGESRGAV